MIASATASADAPSVGEIVRIVFALLSILALAFLAGHPRVRALEERFGISHVVAAGFPFIVLGVLARSFALLPRSAFEALLPIIPLGLGWIGFALGFRFDARHLEDPAPDVGSALRWTTLLPFGLTLLAGGLLLSSANDGGDPLFVRHALILATASVLTGRANPLLARPTRYGPVADSITRIIQLEQIFAVAGLGLIAAFFREGAVAWQLPGVAWVFVTLGLSAVAGTGTYAALTLVTTKSESILVLFGAIAFTAGMASYLALPPTVVLFLAGVVVSTIPSSFREDTQATLDRLEGPVYLLFLFLVGAQLSFGEQMGWALLAVFFLCRLVGKGLSSLALGRWSALNLAERRALSVSPIGALAIAIAISAYDLYPGVVTSWLVTAIVGSAVLMELTVQLFVRRVQSSQASVEGS